MEGFRRRARGRPELLAQKAAQLLVRQQCFGDVPLDREHLHQESVPAFPVWRQLEQGARRALRRCELGSRKAKPNGRDTFVRPQQNVF